MRICFYNTQNIVAPTLEDVLEKLNQSGYEASAYISYASYQNRSSNKIDKFVRYAKLTWLTKNWIRLNQLMYVLSVSVKLIISVRTKHIFLTQPPLAYIWFSFLCRTFNKPYAIHIMDQYPELLSRMGLLSSTSAVYKMLISGRSKAFQGAAFIVVLGNCMKNMVLETGIPKENVHIVKNIPSIEAQDHTESDRHSDVTDSLQVLYAGNMGMAHSFSTILKASQLLDQDNIQFVFLGKGKRRHEIEKFIKDKSPSNVKILAYLEKEEFEYHLNNADIHFISLRKGFEGLMVPSKLYSSLAAGKAVIYEGPENSEIAMEIKKYGFGKSVEPGKTDVLVDAIKKLLQFS